MKTNMLPSHAKYIFPKFFNSIINDSTDKNVLNSIEWTEGRSHSFGELDHEIIYGNSSHFSQFKKGVVVSYKRKYVHRVLVSRCAKYLHVKV